MPLFGGIGNAQQSAGPGFQVLAVGGQSSVLG